MINSDSIIKNRLEIQYEVKELNILKTYHLSTSSENRRELSYERQKEEGNNLS